jgi:hypothetical protein
VEHENEYIVVDQPNQKMLKNINYFCFGFVIYAVSYIFSITIYANANICQFLEIVGLLLFVYGAMNLIQFKIDNIYLKIVYVLYIAWLITIIPRGFHFNFEYLKGILFSPFGILLYSVPLVLLFPRNLGLYKKMFNIIFILNFFFIAYDILFIKDLINPDQSNLDSQGLIENFSQILSIHTGFLLLTYVYLTPKRKLFVLGIIVITLLFGIIRARRGLIFMTLCMIIFSYILYLFISKKKILVIFFSTATFFFGALYLSKVFSQKNKGLFSFLLERGTEDTRTSVEECFYQDFQPKDWIIGKGMDGEYYCPGVDENDITGYRPVIETGYLQIILKGGMVSLGLFLLIAIPAMIKGIFFSKNTFSKAAGIWIFLSLVYLYPAALNYFSLFYVLVWISIAICYSKNIRNMSENSVREYFLSE